MGDPLSRARQLAAAGQSTPALLDQLLDLNLAFRLINSWADGKATDPRATDRLIRANFGRARARLRATIAAGEPDFASHLLTLPALYARTRRAVASYARDWASREYKRGFTFSGGNVDAPCVETDPAHAPYAANELAMLETWVLRALLVDPRHVEDLDRWVRNGGIGRKSATWNRLLSEQLPDALQDPLQPGQRYRRRLRLRSSLLDRLDAIYETVRPVIRDLGALDPTDRSCARRFKARVAAQWHTDVPPLKQQFKRYTKNAAEVSQRLDKWLEGDLS